MIELDITAFFNTECPRDYSASIAELGPFAGRDTWQAAVENAPDHAFVTDENRDEVIAHFRAYGAWTDEELQAHSNDELCAMLLQDISGTMRDSDMGPGIDWAAYEAACEAGTYSGRIFRADDGRVFFYIGD
jgi:hypothetical protein